MKYVLIAIWIGVSPGGSWNAVSMQEFDSAETCNVAERIIQQGHNVASVFTKKINTYCIKK